MEQFFPTLRDIGLRETREKGNPCVFALQSLRCIWMHREPLQANPLPGVRTTTKSQSGEE
jgi:hypothetical protein